MPARLVRVTLSLCLLALPALILTRQWVEAVTGAGVGWFGIAQGALVAAALVVAGSATTWARRRGLSWTETSRLLFGATATSSGWSAPALRRLLAPAHGGVRAPERNVPGDYRRAIGEVVAHLQPPLRAPAERAAEAAYRLVGALSLCDDELGILSVASGATDADRLGAQIAVLDGARHPGDEARELAGLLRAQLDVVHRMRVRCEMLSSRRGHLMQLLHGTWSHLAAIAAGEFGAVSDELDRLDALRVETERELETPANESA